MTIEDTEQLAEQVAEVKLDDTSAAAAADGAADGDATKTKKKRKRTNRNKNKTGGGAGGAAPVVVSDGKQTSPPTIPVDDLFPGGIFPIGEIQEYKDE